MEILFNPIDPVFLEDPYPTYARLREKAPIYRHPGGFQAVSRHEDVVAVLKDPARFSSAAMGGADRFADPSSDRTPRSTHSSETS